MPVPLFVAGVGVRYGALEALADIHLQVQPGEVVAVIGPSGCGKSSLLRAVAGLVPSRGTVQAGERTLSALPAHARGVGVVFQDYALFPHLNVLDNVAFGLVEARLPKREREQRALRWLETVGLAARAHSNVDTLSGGEQSRVALARTLAPEPAWVVLDEPFAALDAGLRLALSREVVGWLRNLQAATLFVTHDLDEAVTLADRILLLRAGRIEDVNTPERLLKSPRSPWAARFLGHANVWEGDAARALPGAPTRAMLRSEACSWQPGETTHASVAAGVHSIEPGRQRWRLHLHVPAWSTSVVWEAHPRELPGGQPPAVGTHGHLTVPFGAWWHFPEAGA
jgi:ABC-type Fe3+/spermidine/putrescine transport system ATPase subunit